MVTACTVLTIGSATVANAGGSQSTEPKGCVIDQLTLPDGLTDGGVYEGDPTGQYLAGAADSDNGLVPILWTDGQPTRPEPPDLTNIQIADVNSSGTVVGNGDVDRLGPTVPWTYADGGYTRLSHPAEANRTIPSDINSNGDIVGFALYENAPAQALLWRANDPDNFQVLQAPGDVRATGISDDGAVIGSLGPVGGEQFGYVWTDTGVEGERLVGPNGTDQTTANDINGPWITGSETIGTSPVGALWNLDTGEVIQRPYALGAVNSSGDAIMNRPHQNLVLVRPDGSALELPGLPGEASHSAHVLFDRASDRTAAGFSFYEVPPSHAVVWRGC